MANKAPPGIKRGRLSADEEKQIELLAERGSSSGQIALRLNRHPATINFAMHRMGLREPVTRSFAYSRGGRAVKNFSADEDAFIEALRCQRFTYQKIARIAAIRFGHRRSAATIGVRLKMLGNKEG